MMTSLLVVSEIQTFQTVCYNFVPVTEIITWLDQEMVVAADINEKECYNTSLLLEPRGANRSDIV